ncbi:FkbM family methyltransferase [Methylobacterium phyllosphaerae]
METELLTTFMSILGIREKLETRPHLYSDELNFLSFAAKYAPYSNSQALQDLWVLYETQEKRHGYFVEFGICDGKTLSNTLLLEKMFGWQGAVAEPGRIWHKKLYANRSCFISNKCIYKKGGLTLSFHETDVTELSTLDSFVDSDFQSSHRTGGARYDVETISLADFLASAKSPKDIDYMSIDIEGGSSTFCIASIFRNTTLSSSALSIIIPKNARAFMTYSASGVIGGNLAPFRCLTTGMSSVA